MDRLNDQNMKQAIVPATWEQMRAELPECVAVLVDAAMGRGEGAMAELPAWYVLTKAAGATGIPLQQLYDDPTARQHALAVLAADTSAGKEYERMVRVMDSKDT